MINPSDFEALVIRIDERVTAIMVSSDKIEDHLRTLNGSVAKHSEKLCEQDEKFKSRQQFASDNRRMILALWSLQIIFIVGMTTYILGFAGIK